MIEILSGMRHVATLPTESPIVDLQVDGGDVIATTADGAVFRVDLETGRIKAN